VEKGISCYRSVTIVKPSASASEHSSLEDEGQPVPNKWHPLFIATLFWNDHSLRIWLEDVSQLTPQQVANVDYIILLSEFEAKVIRPPNLTEHMRFKKLNPELAALCNRSVAVARE
jgi:hypothetical protein